MAQTNAQFAGFDEFIAGKEKAEKAKNLNKAAQKNAKDTTNALTNVDLKTLGEKVALDESNEAYDLITINSSNERNILEKNGKYKPSLTELRVVGGRVFNLAFQNNYNIENVTDAAVYVSKLNVLPKFYGERFMLDKGCPGDSNALTYFGEKHLANAA